MEPKQVVSSPNLWKARSTCQKTSTPGKGADQTPSVIVPFSSCPFSVKAIENTS